jgi:PST family polysaccharide transporter
VLQRLMKHVVVRNVLLLYVVQISGYLMPIVTLPYLTHVLTTEKFGLISYAQSFMWYFITLTEYSFNLTATRHVAMHRENPEELSKTFAVVMASKFLLTLAGFVILAAVVFSIPRLRENWAVFFVTFLSVVGNFLFPSWLFQGLQKMEQVALRDFAAKLIGLGALFLLVHRDSDYLLAAGVQSGSLALAGLTGLASVPFMTPVRLRLPAPRAMWDSLKEGWPLFLSIAATSFTAASNVFILGLTTSNAEVAYFSGAQRIISALRSLVSPMAAAVYPHVSAKAAISEFEAVQFIRKYTWLLVGPFFLIGLALVTGGPWMIRLVLGARYATSIPVIQIMAFSPFLLALSHVYSTFYMLPCGYDKPWMRRMLLSVAVNFVFLFALLPLLRGSFALAVTIVLTDVFCVAAYWTFYIRHRPAIDTTVSLP